MINKEIKKLALKKLENIDLNLQQKQTLLDVMSMVSKDVATEIADWSIKNDYYKRINEENGVDYTKCVEIRNLTNETNTITIKNTNAAVISPIAKNVTNENISELAKYILYPNNDIITYTIPPNGIAYMDFVILYGMMNKIPRVLFEKDVALKGKIIANGRTNFDYLFSDIEVDENNNVNLNNIPANNIVDCRELNIEISSAKYMFAGNINLTETPNIVFNSNGDVDLTGMFYSCKALNKVYINKDISPYDSTKQHDYILDKMLYDTKGGNIYNFTKTVQGQTEFMRANSSKPNDYHYLTITNTDIITNSEWNVHNEFYLAECKAQSTNNVYNNDIWSVNYIDTSYINQNTIYTPYMNVVLQTIDCPNDRARWVLFNPTIAGQKMKHITNLFPENKIVYYKHVYIKNCVSELDLMNKCNITIINGDSRMIVKDINDKDFIPYYNSRSSENFQLVLNADIVNNISVRFIGDLATFSGHETGYICTNYFNENNSSPISVITSTYAAINAEINFDESNLIYFNCIFNNSAIHGVKDGLTIKGKDLRKSKLRFKNCNGIINYDINKITGGDFTETYRSAEFVTYPDFSNITKVDNKDNFVCTFQNNTKIKSIDLSSITDIGEVPFKCRFLGMFMQASNLQEVIVPNIKEWDTNIFNNWLNGAGSSVKGDKIIRKPVGLDIPSGDSGIPDGWIVKEYYKGPVYLKNESDEVATFIVGDTLTYPINLEYSLDNNEYKKYDLDNKPIVEIQPNQSIYLRGINTNIEFTKELHFKFKLDKTFSSSGDPKYLLNYRDINSIKEIPAYCFNGCFANNEEIIKCDWDMSKITKINTIGCGGMFNNCTNLISIFDFPDLIEVDYQGLLYFCNNCTSLEKGSEFPKLKTIGFKGCHYCFYNCISMKDYNTTFSTVIDIDEFAFCGMFYSDKNITTKFDFSNIKEVKNKSFQNITRGTTITEIITPNISTWDSNNFINWLPYKSSGTIYKPINLTIPTGDSGVPTGWTTKNYGE